MKQDLEGMFPSLTEFEKRHLNRKPQSRTGTAKTVLFVLLVALGIVALFVELGVVNPFIEKVHAADTEAIEVHQNDYYCRQIQFKGMEVRGARAQEILDLCKSWGVNL